MRPLPPASTLAALAMTGLASVGLARADGLSFLFARARPAPAAMPVSSLPHDFPRHPLARRIAEAMAWRNYQAHHPTPFADMSDLTPPPPHFRYDPFLGRWKLGAIPAGIDYLYNPDTHTWDSIPVDEPEADGLPAHRMGFDIGP